MTFLDRQGLARLWANILALVHSKVDKSTKINNKELSSDVTLTAEDVHADEKGSADVALQQAQEYTDELISGLNVNYDDIDNICGKSLEVVTVEENNLRIENAAATQDGSRLEIK